MQISTYPEWHKTVAKIASLKEVTQTFAVDLACPEVDDLLLQVNFNFDLYVE